MTARRPFYVALLVAALGSLGFVSVNGAPWWDSVTTTSTGNAVTVQAGGKVCLDGSACTYYLTQSGTSVLLNAPSAKQACLAGNGGALWCIDTTVGAYTTYPIVGQNGSGSDAFKVSTSGARWHFGAGAGDWGASDGTTFTFNGPVKSSATQTRGTITLSAGTGTATVITGAVCICTDTTANASVKCAVATTTLTATGTASDVIAYVCL